MRNLRCTVEEGWRSGSRSTCRQAAQVVVALTATAGSDTVARRYMEETGTSEAEIDIFFGWHEKVLLKAMQVHYASMSIRERMKKSKITGKL